LKHGDWGGFVTLGPSGYPLRMAKEVKKKQSVARCRISSKNQITIPVAALRTAGFAAGDVVRVEASGAGQVVLTKLDELVDRYSGALQTGGRLREQAQALRDEWT
jgi:bifunctional DNA-binding transcriptional regulator/antitoxin component of YhaV-PrlF toxin-antitoxin module